ncbi:MAG: hypothetical protein ABI435_02850 [Pseudolysinimonas sp.]
MENSSRLKIRLSRILAVSVVVAGLVGVGGVAWAGNSYVAFNLTLPVAQVAGNTASQTKATTGLAGNIHITSVGSTYTVDAQMCSLFGLYCGGGTKVFGLNDGQSSTLQNSYGGGGSGMVAQLRIGSFNSVSVQVIGSWRSR